MSLSPVEFAVRPFAAASFLLPSRSRCAHSQLLQQCSGMHWTRSSEIACNSRPEVQLMPGMPPSELECVSPALVRTASCAEILAYRPRQPSQHPWGVQRELLLPKQLRLPPWKACDHRASTTSTFCVVWAHSNCHHEAQQKESRSSLPRINTSHSSIQLAAEANHILARQ